MYCLRSEFACFVMFSPKFVTEGTNKEEGGQTTRHKRKFSGNQPFTPKVWTVYKVF